MWFVTSYVFKNGCNFLNMSLYNIGDKRSNIIYENDIILIL
jgi:hypothetical protein